MHVCTCFLCMYMYCSPLLEVLRPLRQAKRRDLEASQTLLQEALETKGQLQEALEAAQERAFGLQEEAGALPEITAKAHVKAVYFRGL